MAEIGLETVGRSILAQSKDFSYSRTAKDSKAKHT